jgi:hypothetical protein
MPTLGPQRRNTRKTTPEMPGYPCSHCGQLLQFVRKHVSPPRLGPAVETEFYQCVACDSGFARSPSTGKWKPWMADE